MPHLLAAIDCVEERPLALACLGLLTAAGVVVGMASVAGFHAVDRVLAVLAYGLLRLLLSIPPALLARGRVQQLLERARAGATS